MMKTYMLLNLKEVSDLIWCVMNAPERSEAEKKRHLKLHERLLKAEHDLKIATLEKKSRDKRRKEANNG